MNFGRFTQIVGVIWVNVQNLAHTLVNIQVNLYMSIPKMGHGRTSYMQTFC